MKHHWYTICGGARGAQVNILMITLLTMYRSFQLAYFAYITLSVVAVGFLYVRFKKAQRDSLFLDGFMEASERGMAVFDKKGRLLRYNGVAEPYLDHIADGEKGDLSREAFMNHLFDNAADFDEAVKNTILGGVEGTAIPEFREVISDGRGGLCLIEVREMDGGMTLFLLTDISVRRRREQNIMQLNTLNTQLMHAVQATKSGIVISDPKQDGNPILFANDAYCEFVQCTRTDLIGSNWALLMKMFESHEEKENFINALLNNQEDEFSLIGNGHSENSKHYNLKLSPVHDDEGDVDLFIGVLSDVTLLKQREAEFFQAQKLESLGQLAAGVAHDFNNILSIISGYAAMAEKLVDADVANDEGESNEKLVQFLQKIDAASARGAGLTRKMLMFSKHKVVSNSVVNLHDIVLEQTGLLTPLLGVSVELEVNTPDDSVHINGSSDSIGQIVMNLAINARDAMPSGGKLSVDLSCQQAEDVPGAIHEKVSAAEYACISVRDTGTGMDKELLKRIFDPFFSTKESGKGTGLGLSVVYGLVHEMGGAFDVSSAMGQGTIIQVFFPLVHGEVTKQISGDTTDIANIRFDGYTVLLAEDEQDLLELVGSTLEDLGMTVLSAANGDEALLLQDEHEDEIDLLLTDVIMPGLNGVKLAELFSALRPDSSVVFMSGYPANGDMAPVELPAEASFIAKPVDFKKLIKVIYQKLNKNILDSGSTDAIPRWETASLEKDKVENV